MMSDESQMRSVSAAYAHWWLASQAVAKVRRSGAVPPRASGPSLWSALWSGTGPQLGESERT
jgi:hypothetical protein